MTAMRAFTFLAAALVLTAALAGCMGAKKDGDDVDTASTGGAGSGSGSGSGAGSGTAPALKVLSALNSSIATDAPAWIQSGSDINVTLTAPANAKGAVTYAWAIGPLPGTVDVKAVTMDTGSKGTAEYIAPGGSKSLKFSAAGIYRMHCHPHPAMRHNVTVVDGYAGPQTVEVFITDGANQNEYRYVPENIVVGTNTTVVYKNVGTQPHTSTALGAQEPALKALPLKADKGAVKVEGNGWQRLVAIFTDSEGRIGITEKAIYTTPTLPEYAGAPIEMSFDAGAGPLAGTPVATTVAASKSEPLTFAHPGTITINYTFADGPGGVAPEANQAGVEVHLVKDGETQDSLTGDGASGSLTGKVLAGGYTLTVVPTSGVMLEGTITISMVYDLVPPPPTKPAAGGGDAHGGHAH